MLSKIMELELIMVLLILAGVLLRRRGILTDPGRDCITDLVMTLVLPCNIFMSFQVEVTPDVFQKFGTTMAISLLVMVGVAVLGKLCYRKLPEHQAKVFQYGLVNSNSIFIGMPMIQSLLGDAGIVQQNMYMIFVRIFCWSYGLSLYTGKKADWKQSVRALLLHPCMLATLLGLAFMVLGVPLPAFARRTMNYLGDCLMALSMLLIGGILAEMDWKKLFRRDVWMFSALRLVVVPGMVFAGCLLFQVDSLVAATCTLLAGMPAASLTAVLAARYRCDAELGSLIVTASTLVSALTIPMWYLLLT